MDDVELDAVKGALCALPYPYFRADQIASIEEVGPGFTCETASGSHYRIVEAPTDAPTTLRAEREAGDESLDRDQRSYACDIVLLVARTDGLVRLAGLSLVNAKLQRAFITSALDLASVAV